MAAPTRSGRAAEPFLAAVAGRTAMPVSPSPHPHPHPAPRTPLPIVPLDPHVTSGRNLIDGSTGHR
ncbi:hypothetical protein T261_05092 [Streptomyces lydicus]|nr:hypothetical protein T261_05092 [Streptomyces lydicus]